MYRILAERLEVAAAPQYWELLAIWSWDITKLSNGAISLYVILDIFSRYVVGWMVASRLAKVLIAQSSPSRRS